MTSNKGLLIIGATPQGLQAALTLAHFGREVTLIDRDSEIDRPPRHWSDKGSVGIDFFSLNPPITHALNYALKRKLRN